MNNRAEDITNEPRARGVCRKCGEIAHSPYRCYDEKPTTICRKCGQPTGAQRLRYCDLCAPANTLAKRRSRRLRVAA